MCYQIGSMYKASWTMGEAAAVAGAIGLAAFFGQIVAMEA